MRRRRHGGGVRARGAVGGGRRRGEVNRRPAAAPHSLERVDTISVKVAQQTFDICFVPEHTCGWVLSEAIRMYMEVTAAGSAGAALSAAVQRVARQHAWDV